MPRRGKCLLCAWPPPPPATGTGRAAGCHPRWGDGRAGYSLPSKSGQIRPQGEAWGILHPAVLRASKAGRSLLLGKMTVQVLEGQVGPGEGAIQLVGVPISEPKVREVAQCVRPGQPRMGKQRASQVGGWGPRVGVCPFPSASSPVVREQQKWCQAWAGSPSTSRAQSSLRPWIQTSLFLGRLSRRRRMSSNSPAHCSSSAASPVGGP